MTGVTIGCFLLSYLAAWAIELSRLWFRLPGRFAWLLIAAAFGLLAHGMYLSDRIRSEATGGGFGLPSTAFDWTMVAAFGLGLVYAILVVRRRESILGVFILPLLIGMIVAAIVMRGGSNFGPRADREVFWAYLHGGGFAVAAVSVSIGLVMALLRVWQQHRLKAKRPLGGRFRLPSLEYLDSFGRSCLIVSTAAIATGWVGGVVMTQLSPATLSWTDPGVVLTSGLLLWLLTAIVLEVTATRHRGTRTVWLNIVTFVLTSGTICYVAWDAHGGPAKETGTAAVTTLISAASSVASPEPGTRAGGGGPA